MRRFAEGPRLRGFGKIYLQTAGEGREKVSFSAGVPLDSFFRFRYNNKERKIAAAARLSRARRKEKVGMEKISNVAVFIDAENVPSASAKQIFDEASNYGNILVKRIYADWSKASVKGWKEEVNRYSMTAEQQFEVQARKNTTDIALIIQALIILFEKDVDVFFIAAGDSDYTRLVRELRERGKTVIGLGGRNVNQSYVNAFNEFIYLDGEEPRPAPAKKGKAKGKPQPQPVQPAPPQEEVLDNKRKSDLHNIIDRLIDNSGKAFFAQISSEMKQKYSDFIPKNFGCNSFKKLMEKLMPYLKKYSIGTNADGTTMYLCRREK